MWWEVITEALLDTLKLFPFLFAMYILIELMEHKTKMGRPSRMLSGAPAPLVGAAAGLVPMCGFSVMAAKLYRHRHISLGALFAVFIASSDEAVLVLLDETIAAFAGGEGGGSLLLSLVALLGSKLLLGVLVGYAVDLVLHLIGQKRPAPLPEHVHSHGHDHEHDHAHDHEHEHGHSHEEHAHAEDEAVHERGECACDELSVCEHKKESPVALFLLSPLLHAFEVAAFVLLVNLAFGFLFFGLGGGNVEEGETLVGAFMNGAGYWWQPLLCALVGLVPNCASSVILAETYSIGGIAFGGMLGGLVTNTGLGCLALVRGGVKSALLIAAALFLLGTVFGYAALSLGLLF